MPQVHPENFPELLKSAQFCLWRYEHDKSGKPTKVPYQPKAPQYRADVSEPKTFASMDKALQALQSVKGFDGIGIRVKEPISAGIDIDHCVNDDGSISAMAQEIIDALDTYTEISPSGHGIRMFVRLDKDYKYDSETYYKKNPKNGLEIYRAGATKRILSVTGNVLRNKDIENRTEQLQPILDKYMERPITEQRAESSVSVTPLSMSDQELIDKAADKSDKFRALWSGDISGYNSQSEADMALCGILAFWTQCDSSRMDILFRSSMLYRKKWDSRRGSSSYGADTIAKAIKNNTNVYDPEYGQKQKMERAKKDFTEQQEQEEEQSPMKLVNMTEYMTADFESERKAAEGSKSTGFPELDRHIGDGFHPGLHVITGATGMGKTTFVLQIAEHMAASGTDVLYFSLEMSRLELASKGLSRLVVRDVQGTKGESFAPTALDIRQGKGIDMSGYIKDYMEHIAPHLYIMEGNFALDIGTIRETVKEFITAHPDSKPAVFIDYLQIVRPTVDMAKKATKDIITDIAVSLRQMSRDFNAPVIAISAMARSQYDQPVSFDGFKESGGIDYTCDTAMGLEWKVFTDTFKNYGNEAEKKKVAAGKKKPRGFFNIPAEFQEIELNKAKAQTPRRILFKCIKTRDSKPPFSIEYLYDSAHDIFVEQSSAVFDFDAVIGDPGDSEPEFSLDEYTPPAAKE